MNFVERKNPVNRQTIKKCTKSNDSVTWQKTCLNNNMSEIINYWILSAWSEKCCHWATIYLYSEHNDKIGGRTFKIGDLNLSCFYDLLPTRTPLFLFAFASPRDKNKVSTKLLSTMVGTTQIIIIFTDFLIIRTGPENPFPTTLPICDINTIHKMTHIIPFLCWIYFQICNSVGLPWLSILVHQGQTDHTNRSLGWQHNPLQCSSASWRQKKVRSRNSELKLDSLELAA